MLENSGVFNIITKNDDGEKIAVHISKIVGLAGLVVGTRTS